MDRKIYHQNIDTPDGIKSEPNIEKVEDWTPESMEEKTADRITSLLQKEGATYFAGGYVRDLLMKQIHDKDYKPKDIDIATELEPEKVKEILEAKGFATKDVGAHFGVILAYPEGEGQETALEIATFRKEEEYTDGRRPDEVTLIREPSKDAERRDFTINALFFDPSTGEVVDYVDGLKDLKEKNLQPVGNARERFEEDYLRMLRYVRFRAKYGFSFSQEIKEIIRDNAENILNIAPERIFEELDKIMAMDRRHMAIGDLTRLGLTKQIIPELAQTIGCEHPKDAPFHQEGDVYRHTLESLRAMSRSEYIKLAGELMEIETKDEKTFHRELNQRYGTEIAWAVLIHDLGKTEKREVVKKDDGSTRVRFHGHESVSAKIADDIGRRFKMPNAKIEKIKWLVANHMINHRLAHKDQMKKSKRRRFLQHEWIEELILVGLADQIGNFPSSTDDFQSILEMLREERARPEEPNHLLDGNQIMKEFELKPGPVIGEIKEIVREAQLEEKIKTPEEALGLVRKYLESKP